jgi:ASC-1-like (ASCH) protein
MTPNNRLNTKKGKKIVRTRTKKNSIRIKPSAMSTHLSEPWFSLMATGLKTVEGRLSNSRLVNLTIGDRIIFYNDDFNHRKIVVKIVRKTSYPDFKTYLEKETLAKTVPGQPDIEHGLAVYYKYYSKEAEREHGITAIEVECIG